MLYLRWLAVGFAIQMMQGVLPPPNNLLIFHLCFFLLSFNLGIKTNRTNHISACFLYLSCSFFLENYKSGKKIFYFFQAPVCFSYFCQDIFFYFFSLSPFFLRDGEFVLILWSVTNSDIWREIELLVCEWMCHVCERLTI